jgi:putative adhesin
MRLSSWGRVVAISALLILGGAVALAIGAVVSSDELRASYPVTGSLDGLAFDLGAGDIVIVGGGRREAAEVERVERYAFGHGAKTEPAVDGGVFRVRSRCPTSLLGGCTVAYRVIVPDNVALDIRTSGGHVSLRGYRGSAKVTTGGGAIDISGYCGNSLDARAGAGAITLDATCAPPRLSLRSGSGPIRAVLPPGRYDVDAESSSGSERVRGLTPRPDAPYSVQVLSASGDVSVEGRS